uniref:Uncharacterized protein n=1 Tax=Arundo donax TaxID=35708 RepID=A0A0A9BIU9_ARUDO
MKDHYNYCMDDEDVTIDLISLAQGIL